MLKMGKFYKLKYPQQLYRYCIYGPHALGMPKTKNVVLGTLHQNELVLIAKRARFRYIQIICKDVIGYIWVPINKPTYDVFEPVEE
jgi:hypothetical protein